MAVFTMYRYAWIRNLIPTSTRWISGSKLWWWNWFPVSGLTILSVLLVRCMHKAEARRKHLRGKKDDDTNRDRKTNRTTRMLLIVVILFVLTELPQGILSLLSGILPSFFDQIYSPMGDMLDILALVNNGINFILYCTMSKQFRETFIQVFFKNLRNETRKFSLVPTNGNTKLTDLWAKHACLMVYT